ncbi:putative leucine-rich repeat-containing protein DDB_G0290503 [Cloeon dipterum]|uniref:putative leucine-rich repeat-containing protein DDB_G0290503 n=1 Tax=Cloeon dipterum TaxID=197152 RepID=UPI003220686C
MQKQHQERQHVLAAGATKDNQSTSLTVHLQTTTDSVIKMKMQLESEVKQRDSKIAELQSTIKEMTKNLINLQQHSESLSHKLQYELLKRGNIIVKVESTRNICSTLQEHIKFLSDTLKRCTEEKDLMKTVQLEYLTELEALVIKTRDCQKTLNEVSHQRDCIVQKFNFEKQARQKLLEEVSAMKQESAKMLDDVKEAENAARSREDKLAEQISQKDAELIELKTLNESVSSQLKQLEETSKEKQMIFDADREKLETAIAERDCFLSEKNAELEKCMSELQSKLNTIHELERETTELIASVASKESEICLLSSQLSAVQQELHEKISSLDAMLSEKTSLEEKVSGIAPLEAEIEELKVASFNASEEIKNLLEKCETSNSKCSELESLLVETKLLFCQGKAQLEELALEAGSLRVKNENLEREMKSALDKLQQSREIISNLQNKVELEMKERESLQLTLDVLKSSNETESGEMTNKVAQLSSLLAKSKTELAMKDEAITNLINQISTLQISLDEALELRSNERKALESKTSNLNKELDGKAKEIDALLKTSKMLQENVVRFEEEISQMQNQLKEAATEKEVLLSEKKELEKTLKNTNSEKNSAETKLKRLETKANNLEKEKKELKAKISKAKAESIQDAERKDQAISDFEEALKEKDEHAAELEQTIADLKKASEEELSAHEAKLNDSVAENSKLVSKVEQMNKHVAELEAKVAQLNLQLSNTIKNLDETADKYESQKQKLKEKIKFSEQLITSKDAEIVRLSQSSQTNTKKLNFEVVASKTSIMRGPDKTKRLFTKKIRFRDNVSFISWDGEEDFISSGNLTPGTPVKTQAVPTTPRKTQLRSPMRKISSYDEEDEMHQNVEAGKSSKQNERRYPTPMKRLTTASGDGPAKAKKFRG